MTYTDSDPVEEGLQLLGLWIHDPLDPEGTIRQFVYAKSQRSSSIDTLGTGHFYAGRQFQVVDYGEHQDDGFGVRLDIPHGADWAADLVALTAFAEGRRTLCYRDGRGRLFFGAMSGYKEDDQNWGTAVAFGVTRVDFDESVV